MLAVTLISVALFVAIILLLLLNDKYKKLKKEHKHAGNTIITLQNNLAQKNSQIEGSQDLKEGRVDQINEMARENVELKNEIRQVKKRLQKCLEGS